MPSDFNGTGLSAGEVEGIANVIPQRDQLTGQYEILETDIVVTDRITPELADDIRNCRGLVVTEGSFTSHGGIVSRELGIPAVGECPPVLDHIETDQTLFLNGETGEIHVTSSENSE